MMGRICYQSLDASNVSIRLQRMNAGESFNRVENRPRLPVGPGFFGGVERIAVVSSQVTAPAIERCGLGVQSILLHNLPQKARRFIGRCFRNVKKRAADENARAIGPLAAAFVKPAARAAP